MSPLEGAGWALLALLTLAVAALAVLRPTDPAGVLNEIRLAAGFDRYEAALDEGDRIHSTVVAELRRTPKGDLEAREALYGMLEQAAQRYEIARRESEGFYENQRAQIRLARTYLLWARSLHEDGTGAWYERNDEETLRRARAVVDQGLALPDIPGDRRVALEELGTRIDRALTPWPIL
ncbi:MAG TPA: hypothetical protein VJ982_08675 [Gemmatimonadota bacterium]|nr:hypothetical protein [Gemmatimonadota bacterium]